ncbi:hypothetical protein [Yersinia phage vB_YenM_P778]
MEKLCVGQKVEIVASGTDANTKYDYDIARLTGRIGVLLKYIDTTAANWWAVQLDTGKHVYIAPHNLKVIGEESPKSVDEPQKVETVNYIALYSPMRKEARKYQLLGESKVSYFLRCLEATQDGVPEEYVTQKAKHIVVEDFDTLIAMHEHTDKKCPLEFIVTLVNAGFRLPKGE